MKTMSQAQLHPQDNIAGAIVDVCRRLSARGLLVATDGNVSARLQSGNILITRAGVSKGFITEDDLVEVKSDGTGGHQRSTTEIRMHVFVYEKRQDVRAIVHAHPPFATAFAVAGIPLDRPVLPEVVVGLGGIPLAAYATPSTDEVPESLSPYVEHHDAILLSNHGAITFGEDLHDACFKMEKVEHTAEITYRARLLGAVRELSEDDLAKLRAIAPATYGKEVKR